jgi:hypothetical protein
MSDELEWKPVDDEEHVTFLADFMTFQACLTDYEPPVDRPDDDATDLERLRWQAARYSESHPELHWRVWIHPQSPEHFWIQIGHGGESVDRNEALHQMHGADAALRAYKALK